MVCWMFGLYLDQLNRKYVVNNVNTNATNNVNIKLNSNYLHLVIYRKGW